MFALICYPHNPEYATRLFADVMVGDSSRLNMSPTSETESILGKGYKLPTWKWFISEVWSLVRPHHQFHMVRVDFKFKAFISKSACSRRSFWRVLMLLNDSFSIVERRHCISNIRLLSIVEIMHSIAFSSRPARREKPKGYPECCSVTRGK